jgi:hypothetical protein
MTMKKHFWVIACEGNKYWRKEVGLTESLDAAQHFATLKAAKADLELWPDYPLEGEPAEYASHVVKIELPTTLYPLGRQISY